MTNWSTPNQRKPIGIEKPIRFIVVNDITYFRYGVILKENAKTFKTYWSYKYIATFSLGHILLSENDLIAGGEKCTCPNQLSKDIQHRVFDSYSDMVEFISRLNKHHLEYQAKRNPIAEELRAVERDYREELGLMFTEV